MRRRTGDAVLYRPYQEAASDFPTVGIREFEEAVQWIEGGETLSGADAVFRALEFAGWPLCRFRSWVRRIPGGTRLSRWGYGVVARHRQFFSRWTRCVCKK